MNLENIVDEDDDFDSDDDRSVAVELFGLKAEFWSLTYAFASTPKWRWITRRRLLNDAIYCSLRYMAVSRFQQGNS